ncbi:MAG: DUF402 domain-containing protein [Clostridiales bacterium]|nr:DUF402 domain-containing protein [Clostridiales bacterium]
MHQLSLYRRRFLPDELIHLKDDIILDVKDDIIITKWEPLRPKAYMSRGVSAYYLNQGFKVSKIYDIDNLLSHWYCDIVQYKPGPVSNSILFEDLLLDVVVFENDSVKILDLDELADALELQLISLEDTKKALRILDKLLKIIYEGRFDELKDPINKAEAN